MTVRKTIVESQREANGDTTVLLTCGHDFTKRYPTAVPLPKTAVCEACSTMATVRKMTDLREKELSL